ncbi:MAG: hypothetical protein IKL31_08900 [Ruminococcus sp.]|nr:hypothetical protein [Clostridia bacterium]MBR6670840.1 hypothetical protein [Ruminococcus sp.]
MKKEANSKVISISMTPEQYDEIKRRADAEDIHINGFILEHALFGEIPEPDEILISHQKSNTQIFYI